MPHTAKWQHEQLTRHAAGEVKDMTDQVLAGTADPQAADAARQLGRVTASILADLEHRRPVAVTAADVREAAGDLGDCLPRSGVVTRPLLRAAAGELGDHLTWLQAISYVTAKAAAKRDQAA